MTKLLKDLSPLILIAVIAVIGCRKDHFNFNDLPPTVKSFFTVDKTAYDVDEEIHFTNRSEDADSYKWDFGDGTTSTDETPVKSYDKPGIYTVSLSAVGPGGTGNYSAIVTVKDDTPVDVAKEMYFIEYGAETINKVSLVPGSGPELVAGISGKAGVGIAYDSVNNKIYFTDFEDETDGKVWRMNLDGTGMETLVSGIIDPYSIVIDINGGKIYWADDDGNISRAGLDGSDLETSFVHIEDGQMRGIALDSRSNIVYFYEVNLENLYAVKTDGTGLTKIIQDAYGYCIFVDEVNNKLYYEDRYEEAVMQSNLDGSGIVKIADAPGKTRVHGMGIDYSTNKFYWADRDNGVIKRANLDGSGVENFLPGLKSPRGLFIK